MYTEKTFNTLVNVTNIAWHIGIVHFHFVQTAAVKNSKGEGRHRKQDFSLETCFKPAKLNLVKVSFLVSLLYAVFIPMRVVFDEKSESDLGFLVKMGYLFTSYTFPVVLQHTTILKYRETPRWIIEYLHFFKDIKEKYLLPDQKGAKCRKFFSVYFFLGIAITLQNTVILFFKPHQPHMLTSLLGDNPNAAPFLVRLPLYLAHFLIWANVWSNLWVYCFHWFTYTTCSLFLIKELDIYVKRPRTSRHIRDPVTVIKILRSLQVLHRFWEVSFQHWLCPGHKAVVCNLGTLALYGAVKLSGPRAVIMGLVAIICFSYLAILFYKFGQMHEKSNEMINNWRNSEGASKLTRKILASVPEFGIKIDLYLP